MRHRVESGETLYSIADQYRVSKWQEIRFLSPSRAHPQILHPGDLLEIPDSSDGEFEVTLDRRTEFRCHPRHSEPFRVVLVDIDWTPIANRKYRISHSLGSDEGITSPEGAIETALPIGARRVRVTVGEDELELEVGELNPLERTPDDGLSGAQGRLRNLGYFDGALDGRPSDEWSHALRLFQVDHDLPVSGRLDEATRARLGERHGC